MASILEQGAAPQDSPRVFIAGKLTALVSPGGGEVQMRRTHDELRNQGVNAELWRPWEQNLAEADLVHLFGSSREHLETVLAAKGLGIPVVLSTIAWYDLPSVWREPWPLRRRLAACGRYMLRAACPAIPSWRRRLYQACDLLLPNSHAEAEQLIRLFGVPRGKIRVVPNGADERFAAADPLPFARRVGCEGFVLYAGRIEPRKNQLTFLQAMRGVDVPIVILGGPASGHEAYFNACRNIAGPNVTFVSRIEHGDEMLASAYAACGCLTLASWYETPGLVALEAGMSGVPLVLPQRGCAREYFGPLADYVAADDLRAIREQTLSALQKPRSAELARWVRQRYSWRSAAQATREGYEQII